VRSARSYDLSRQTPHTLIVKDLCLCGFLRVYAVELEGEAFSLVLRVGDLHDRLGVRRLCSHAMRSVYNNIFLDLRLEQRANAGDDADTHCIWLFALGGLGVGGEGELVEDAGEKGSCGLVHSPGEDAGDVVVCAIAVCVSC
jgi:hypothetical protein